MHVLVLPSWYPTEDNPANGSFFAEQAAALARYGHRVSVFPLYDDGRVRPAGPPVRRGLFSEYPIHYRTLPMHLTYFRIVREMCRVMDGPLRGDRPEIVHVHSFGAVKYARALEFLYRVPYVVTEHVTWFQRGLLSRRDLRGIGRGYAGAAAVTAVSGGLRDRIQPLCPGKEVRVIPNVVSSRFTEGPLRSSAGEGFHFISVAALDKKKGFDLLLRAFPPLAAKGAALTICGDGPERAALGAQAAALHLGSAVTFAGRVSRERVAELLRQSQCFVLPSRYETFGVAAAEALACGLPIVMTRTDAWEQLATPETGFAVPLEEPEALTRAMERVMACYGDYEPERIRRYAIDHFSEGVIAARFTELFEEALGRT